MKIFKRVFIFAICTLTVLACSPIPKITVNGPNLLLFVDEAPIWQISFPTKEACEFEANQTSHFDTNTKNSFSSGKMRMACSAISLESQLPYKATMKHIFSNERRDTRFQNKEVCTFMDTLSVADPLQGRGWRYDCQ